MFETIEVLLRNGRDWVVIENGAVQLSYVVNNSKQCLVTFKSTDSNIPMQLDITTIVINTLDKNLTVNELLNRITNIGLLSTNHIRSLNRVGMLKYKDLFDTELKADRGVYGSAYITNPRYLPDIKIMFKEGNPSAISTLVNNVLFTINGRIQSPKIKDNSLYLIDGSRIIDRDKNHHLGTINLTELGGFSLIKFNDCIITNNRIDGINNINVNTNVDMVNKTPMIVLDGVLYMLDVISKVSSNNTLNITISDDTLLKFCKIFDNDTNWVNPISPDDTGFNKDTVNIDQLLTNDNSYIVLINTKNIYSRVETIHRTNIAGRYSFYRKPLGLILFDSGELAEYVVTGICEYGVEISTSLHSYQDRLIETSKEGTSGNNSTLQTKDKWSSAYTVDLYTF